MFKYFWLILLLSERIDMEMDVPVSNFTGYKGKYLESELILCSRLTKTVIFVVITVKSYKIWLFEIMNLSIVINLI